MYVAQAHAAKMMTGSTVASSATIPLICKSHQVHEDGIIIYIVSILLAAQKLQPCCSGYKFGKSRGQSDTSKDVQELTISNTTQSVR